MHRANAIAAIKPLAPSGLDFLEKAVEFGISRGIIENDPDLQVLAPHPRYQQILELAR